ncbi:MULTISPECIES: type 2 lanthipeptide synthetase LanM family protein [unclassified Solwaraspora]|uniref:type 2 lanthipeptide synthetase LanM family protein n=1 Tax=unclassified Solwaraspora TaxID=2627926 RepID=UPI00259B8BD5|nr:type 2 lanthipeptide synthetase LanM family protein [Solwaraspora sp. WMMA2056]WJK42049.1 type 2 lanthipeptide synthetase LanM family protein [Solwaraspora sp. WMMA2056]
MSPALALDPFNIRRSAYLHERPASTNDQPTPGHDDLVCSWRDSAFLDDRILDIRLRELAISRAAFGKMISGEDFDPPDHLLDWANELAVVLDTDASEVAFLKLPTRLWSQGFDRLLFSGLIHPFLAFYEARLRERLAERTSIAGLRNSLLEALANRLLSIATRTMLLELNVARLHGKLMGDTPQERYDDYDRRLLTDPDYLRALFGEYPVLGRCLIEAGRRWVDYTAELFERLAGDEHQLRRVGLLPPSATVVSAFRLDLGDPHHGGRSVAQVTFSDGTDLIYKPRSVAAEKAYAETVAALDRQGLSVPVTAPRVLDCGGHGWCEFVRHAPCVDADELSDFYRRAGSVLAVMLLLGGVDMHMENVIAAGSSFTPIDLETVLQCGELGRSAEDAYGRALDVLNRSVLAVGILPARAFGGRQRHSVDVSAIGGGEPQAAPRPIPRVVDAYTDVARIEAVEAVMAGALNRPVVTGGEVQPWTHTSEVVAGFTEAYDLMVAHRSDFDRLLHGFRDVEVRHLARPTRRYSLFLTESFHPDYLRDANDRDRLLDKLWAAADARPELVPIIESERRQLLAGDIPCFQSIAGSREIRTGARLLHPGYFGASAISVLTGRLAEFGPAHRAAQVRIIEDSMGTLPRPRPVVGQPVARPGGHETDPAVLANRIARRLADEAILGTDDVSWIGVSIEGITQETYSYKPLATGLYDGIAGLAVMYAYAARVFGDDRYLEIAHRAARPVVGYLRYLAEHRIVETVGAYSGTAGLLYALDHVAHATGEPVYWEAISEAVPWWRECATREECPDLIAGLAGCAVVALDLHRRHQMPGVRDVAAVCAERLAANVVDVNGAAGWPATPDGPLLGGFSHGAAGIAWPLYRLAAEFDDQSLHELASRAVDFDRALYVPADGAWRDLRPEMAGTGSYPALWCHGGAGIGLSRLLILRDHRQGDSGLIAEADAALSLVAAKGFGLNHSVCHGDFGALSLFDLAERVLPAPGRYERLTASVVGDIATNGMRCGLVGDIYMPGLMLGAAGICLGLLRLAYPAEVPAIAWLETPDSPRTC